MCSEKEKDVVRLRAYGAVVYAPLALLPFLGGGKKILLYCSVLL